MRNRIALFLTLMFGFGFVKAQEDAVKSDLLMINMRVQMECSEAIDSLYNGNFLVAEKQFGWLQEQYPNHPLGDFLMALSQRWKIMPNDEETKYDEKFYYYLEETITKAKKLYKKDKENPELNFFLAAAYGFKAQRLAENGKILAAIGPSEKASDYIVKNLDLGNEYGPEFLYGIGLYNYFREWIPMYKRSLKPIIMTFRKGDMELGIKQLNEVANLSFYSRIEALVTLMDIYSEYGIYDKNKNKFKKWGDAYDISKSLYLTYSNNKYFERRYAELSMLSGYDKEEGARIMSENIEEEKVTPGSLNAKTYRNFSCLYGSHLYTNNQTEEALPHLVQGVKLSEELDIMSAGYTMVSLYYVAQTYENKEDVTQALEYYELLKDSFNKRGGSKYEKLYKPYYKTAKEYIKKHGDKKFLGIF